MPVDLIRVDSLYGGAPYAYASVAPEGALVFTAGACPLDARGAVVSPGDVSAQTRQALANLDQALAAAGVGLADVAKTTVYVASSRREDLVTAWREVEAAFATHDAPSTLLGVSALGYPDQLVEIEAVAVRRTTGAVAGSIMTRGPSNMPDVRPAATAYDDGLETATLAGGCFWCLEPVFSDLRGVARAIPGYSGGHVKNPTYREVCTGTTGHAEAVQVTFDPREVSYRDLLEIFFAVHDPTTLNRQGADVGTQYRSVIFYHSPEQEATARDVIASLAPEPSWEGKRVVTQVEAFEAFYPAEEYHRDYFRRNPEQGYCRLVIAPKYAKFRKRFAERLDASAPQ